MDPANQAYPLVSIVITSYNREHFIARAIQSAQEQDYPNLEIIVCDNASSDNSDALIRSMLTDPRIRYHRHNENIGMIPNFEYAFKSARGKYITSISSDDYLIQPSFVSLAVKTFNENPGLAMVKAPAYTKVKGEEGYEAQHNEELLQGRKKGRDILLKFANHGSIGYDSCLIDNDLLRSIDIVYDRKMTSLDFEMTGKLCLYGDVYYLPEHAYVFYVHGNQASKTYSDEILLGNIRIAERAHELAIKLNAFERPVIDAWRDQIVISQLRYNYIKRYIQNRKEFHQYEQTVRAAYPSVLREIESDPKIRLLRLLYNRSWNLLGLFRFIKPSFGKLVTQFRQGLK